MEPSFAGCVAEPVRSKRRIFAVKFHFHSKRRLGCGKTCARARELAPASGNTLCQIGRKPRMFHARHDLAESVFITQDSAGEAAWRSGRRSRHRLRSGKFCARRRGSDRRRGRSGFRESQGLWTALYVVSRSVEGLSVSYVETRSLPSWMTFCGPIGRPPELQSLRRVARLGHDGNFYPAGTGGCLGRVQVRPCPGDPPRPRWHMP
jgi:hypothetical protein